jgi:hypothetical protein
VTGDLCWLLLPAVGVVTWWLTRPAVPDHTRDPQAALDRIGGTR